MPSMNKPALVTDFVKIGQSGKAIDGRDIAPQWLRDAAETYKQDTYTALIWPEHIRIQNYGKVVELRSDEKDGVVSLYARLAPNASYMLNNRFGQQLFTSMEVAPNFAGTGKAYLVGLGVTDSPASLGTDEIKFSTRKNASDSVFLPGVEFSFPSPEEDGEAPSWFTRFMERFTTTKEDTETMDQKQFDALTAQVDTLAASVKEIAGKVESLAAKPASDEAGTEATPGAGSEAKTEPGTAADGEKFAAIEAGLSKLGTQLDEISKRFEAARPGTTAPASSGPSGEQDPLY
ncbi:capsid scaffolding [Desulfovibrio sp. X2]|uniref:GPO family capsid scaffolding protein n=1 Tax=Desulfovibrio sp. X2 TaxID=941449 RepID=UPI000358F44C|nr:GPO family capsid scaffolding protein [Desulfovibrio sp. X2]EPR43128.1 capsid scaffolding [Desulfovibrio sp. X2]